MLSIKLKIKCIEFCKWGFTKSSIFCVNWKQNFFSENFFLAKKKKFKKKSWLRKVDWENA